MEEEYKRALEVEREKEVKRWEESVRYQEQLENQLLEKERRKQEAYEEFLKEKLMIDEIVRKIYEEDQRYVNCKLLTGYMYNVAHPELSTLVFGSCGFNTCLGFAITVLFCFTSANG